MSPSSTEAREGLVEGEGRVASTKEGMPWPKRKEKRETLRLMPGERIERKEYQPQGFECVTAETHQRVLPRTALASL